MPNIPTYDAPKAQVAGVASFHANASGADAIAQAGRTASQFASASGRMIADSISSVTGAVAEVAEAHYSRSQALDAGAEGMALYNKLNGEWNARRSANPDDPALAIKFNEDVLKPTLEAFNKKYSATRAGQEAASRFQDSMFNHFGQVQVADAGAAADEKAKNDIVTMANEGASVLMRDPTALDFVNKHVVDTMQNYLKANPNITAQGRAQIEDHVRDVKRTNTIAAAHGMAMADPATALKLFKEGGFGAEDLRGEDRSMLVSYAEGQVREAKAMKERQKVEDRRQEQDTSNAVASQAYNTHFNANTGQWTNLTGFATDLKQLAFDHPTVAGPVVKAGLDMIERLTKEANGAPLPIADPATAEDFRKLMLLPVNDPNRLTLAEVYDARARGLISDPQVTLYKDAIENIPKDPNKAEFEKRYDKFLDGMKSAITKSNPLTGERFAVQDQKFYQFDVDMRGQLEAAYKSGGDWKAMLNPKSPSYLGMQVGPYQLDNKAGLAVYKASIKPNATPGTPGPAVPNPAARKPGETIEQYNKRN